MAAIGKVKGAPIVNSTAFNDAKSTGVGAVVIVVLVAIITGFARIDAPVTTDLCAANVVAAVTNIVVAIITAFVATVHDAVTAPGKFTGVCAIVGIDLVAIITDFNTRLKVLVAA